MLIAIAVTTILISSNDRTEAYNDAMIDAAHEQIKEEESFEWTEEDDKVYRQNRQDIVNDSVFEVITESGTKCVVYQSHTITCDWDGVKQ